MEETGILRDLLQASDWMCPIDLKDVAIPFSNHLSGTSTVATFVSPGRRPCTSSLAFPLVSAVPQGCSQS